MKKSLPARPNLEYLRSEAKRLLSDLREGKDDAARALIEYLPEANKMTPADVRRAGFRLADAQSAVARKSGFASWPGLARHVEHLRALEGEWHFVSLETDGRSMPMTSGSRLLVDGDRFRMESPGANYEGIFSIDVDAKPPRIDIEFVEGPEAGQWSYGIYRLDGDDLLLCLGLTGASRPARFATTQGSGHALERLSRHSAARPSNVTGGRAQRIAAPDAEPAEPVDERLFAMRMTPLLEKLQGEWSPVSMITDGQALPAPMLAYGSRTMNGNETKVIFGGQVMVHAKVRIDESQTPIAIDYLNVGRGANQITLGILEMSDDGVRFCMSPAGAPRPDAFACETGTGRILSEWKRKRSSD